MTVIFDLFLFRKNYIEQVKKMKNDKKAKKSLGRSIGAKIEYEVGCIACRNSGRTHPIYFYDLDELVDLLKAAYMVSSPEATEESVKVEEFPDDSVDLFFIEMDKDEPLAGRFVDADGRLIQFKSDSEIKDIVNSHIK